MITVPLPISDLHNVIAENDKVYTVDYSNSKIKGKPFVFYLANLNVKTRINVETLSKEELSELLSVYMEINTLFKCEELNVLVLLVLIHFMEGDTSGIATFETPDGFLDEFVEEHSDLLARYFLFCSSMVKYCDYIKAIDDDKDPDLRGYDGVINDPKYIGVNVVWLFEIPSFFELFFSIRDAVDYRQFYFPVQFEEYMFNGKNLFHFFVGDKENPNWLLLNKYALEILNGHEQPGPDTAGGDSGSKAGTE